MSDESAAAGMARKAMLTKVRHSETKRSTFRRFPKTWKMQVTGMVLRASLKGIMFFFFFFLGGFYHQTSNLGVSVDFPVQLWEKA